MRASFLPEIYLSIYLSRGAGRLLLAGVFWRNMCSLGTGRARELILRIEVVFLALVVGFALATVCYRRGPAVTAVSLPPLLAHVSVQPRLALSRLPAASASRHAVTRKAPSRLVPGYTFAGVGNLPGDDATCPAEATLQPRRPAGALGSMCQPGNVSVHQCSQACEQLESCLGFVWSPRPPWSKYSECYLKGSCPLGRPRAMSKPVPACPDQCPGPTDWPSLSWDTQPGLTLTSLVVPARPAGLPAAGLRAISSKRRAASPGRPEEPPPRLGRPEASIPEA